jgi:multidrug efflux pump subunit AcrA (membrane-fusion protein)
LFFGGLAIGVVAMSAVGLATAVFIETPHEVAARSAAPAATPITAVARLQVLSRTIALQGIVRARRPVLVRAMAPFSTVTLTRMPVKAGDRVRPGHVIAEIDGRPVILLRGRLPAYRNLHEGDHGPDVAQLQRALVSLGYANFDPRGTFGESTALALLLFYRHLGYEAPIFHHRGSGQAGPPSGPQAAGPQTGPQAAGPQAAKTQAGPPFFAIPSAFLPRREVVFIPSTSALVTSVRGRVGDLVGGSVVLTLATGAPYVTANLTAHQASQARKGMPASIVGANPGFRALGTVTRIGSLPPVGGPPPQGFPILVKPARALPQRLIGARVRLTLKVPVASEPVLTVPLSAFVSSGHGPAGHVTVLRAGRRVTVRVLTGPTADGLLAVQPVPQGALKPGDHVLIGAG